MFKDREYPNEFVSRCFALKGRLSTYGLIFLISTLTNILRATFHLYLECKFEFCWLMLSERTKSLDMCCSVRTGRLRCRGGQEMGNGTGLALVVADAGRGNGGAQNDGRGEVGGRGRIREKNNRGWTAAAAAVATSTTASAAVRAASIPTAASTTAAAAAAVAEVAQTRSGWWWVSGSRKQWGNGDKMPDGRGGRGRFGGDLAK